MENIKPENALSNKLLISFLPSLLAAFTVLLWGPVEIIASNERSFVFTLSDALTPLLTVFIAALMFLTVLLFVLPRTVKHYAVSVVFALAVSAYIQGMFMNRDLGLLDGETVDWWQYRVWGFVNLAIWLAVIAGVIVLRRLRKNLWLRVIIFGSAILTIMQLAAFVSVLPSALENESGGNKRYYLSIENEFLLSKNENTVVFVLDNFGHGMLDSTIQTFPDTLDAFHDFTCYDNFSYEIRGTYYALSYLLTRQRYDPAKPYKDYLDNNWSAPETEAFYSALNAANYRSSIFTNTGNICTSPEQLYGKADNLVYGDPQNIIDKRQLIRKMTKISFFRYAPHILKWRFWVSDLDFVNIVSSSRYSLDDLAFYERLKTKGISTQNKYNSYMFYHLNAPHSPWNYNEFIEPSVIEETTREQITRGVLRIVEEYINQMRKAGVYESSNIIITTDHGTSSNAAGLFMIKRAGGGNNETQFSNAPVSQEDYWATLLSLMNIDSLDLGRTVFDWQEGEERTRISRNWVYEEDFPNVSGKYNVIYAYIFTGQAIDTRFRDDPQEIYPLFDSYYGN